MNTLKRSSVFPLLTTMLLGVSACSDNGTDNVGQNIDKATEAGQEKLAESSDAIGHEANKANTTFNDMVLAAKVKNEILKDLALKASDIHVDSQDGSVVLSGAVNKPEDAIRAVQIARGVDEVKSVDSKLLVRSNG
jgi:hyperosmotically inducible periplasmic protein